jgi:hypothetical protein
MRVYLPSDWTKKIIDKDFNTWVSENGIEWQVYTVIGQSYIQFASEEIAVLFRLRFGV